MEEKDKFLGCFVSGPTLTSDVTLLQEELFTEKGRLFRTYIWGENGISNILKKVRNEDYGKDLAIILFQFYVNPIPYELEHLKEIENYRKKEKSIGIPIIVTEENFFSKSEEGRCGFLKQSILQKLDLLGEVVKKKKLDTKVEQLKSDLRAIL